MVDVVVSFPFTKDGFFFKEAASGKLVKLQSDQLFLFLQQLWNRTGGGVVDKVEEAHTLSVADLDTVADPSYASMQRIEEMEAENFSLHAQISNLNHRLEELELIISEIAVPVAPDTEDLLSVETSQVLLLDEDLEGQILSATPPDSLSTRIEDLEDQVIELSQDNRWLSQLEDLEGLLVG